MAHRVVVAAAALLIALIAADPAVAGPVRIGLLGSSDMTPVASALDQVGLPHEQLDAGQLPGRDPGSLDVLFIAYDVFDQDSSGAAGAAPIQWLARFRAAGGVLCTFYTVPPALQELLGIRQGAYLRQQYEGQFAAIHSMGVIPFLPADAAQRSGNIITAAPLGDSVRVVADWYDQTGKDTGYPALLLGPGGVHLTHVLFGEDPDATARLYTALLGHFRPEVWRQAVTGALRAAHSAASHSRDRPGSGGGASPAAAAES